MDTYIKSIHTILTSSFKKYVENGVKNPAVLLSGGIDSTTITYLMSNYFKEYSIFSFGTDFSKDRAYIDIIANSMHKNYEWVQIDEKSVQGVLPKVKNLLMKHNIKTDATQLSLAAGYFMVFEKIKNHKITHIFTGQGPDILLGGYHKYKNSKDVEGDIEKDLKLLEIDKKRDSAIAKYHGLSLINPYLEKEFVKLALSIPVSYKIHDSIEKYILREYGKSLHIPFEIVSRPKKAFQYSTGIQKVILKHMDDDACTI